MGTDPTREPGQPRRQGWQERALFYITHRNNVRSMLQWGILSHSEVERESLEFTPVYNPEIVSRRKGIVTPSGRSLWSYSNLYLVPRNAMLYTVVRSLSPSEVAVLSVQRAPTYYAEGAFITDGNAASDVTEFRPIKEWRSVLKKLRVVDGLEYWSDTNGSKRMMMAEVLVPNRIPASLINGIYVGTETSKAALEQTVAASGRPELPVIYDPYMFFQPEFERLLTPSLALVQGDMFFSGMQTLTISVNTVGVMGKGLASRARYQFPHVYVAYEDMCKKRQLRMGRPALYKTEAPLATQLADEPELLKGIERNWFLLFPTKNDWRQGADKDGIVEGLKWLQENYKQEGITSLALPALGCGLGRLSWEVMGPIICSALATLDIPVQLYLPTERPVPEEQLTSSFLLRTAQTRLEVRG
jgi:O-acetyl-ADP-ribose deacetylase (regulator of RNase III)